MPSITFSGAVLEKVDRIPAAATLHFSCELTAAVAKKMEWGDLPDAAKKSPMDGQLAGGSFVYSPKEAAQKQIEGTLPDEMQANILTVGGFVITRMQIEGSRGKGVKRRINFVLKSADADAAAKAEAWLTMAGSTKGSLRVEYSAMGTAPTQGEDDSEDDAGDKD
jgi:hypothetical protein